jgi:hypothetical protein
MTLFSPVNHLLHRRMPLSPRRVVALARRMVGVEARADFWQPSFAQHVGLEAHHDACAGLSSWPIPPLSSLDSLAVVAAQVGVLSTAWPEPGEIFLAWSSAEGRFVRDAIVERCEWSDGVPPATGVRLVCTTIEWRKVPRSATWRVERRRRSVRTDRGHAFVRWADLDGFTAFAAEDDEEAAICAARMLRSTVNTDITERNAA